MWNFCPKQTPESVLGLCCLCSPAPPQDFFPFILAVSFPLPPRSHLLSLLMELPCAEPRNLLMEAGKCCV